MTWNKAWVPDELKNWDIIEVDDTHDMQTKTSYKHVSVDSTENT